MRRDLTRRQRAILHALVEGGTYQAAAQLLRISPITVRNQLVSARERRGAKSVYELCYWLDREPVVTTVGDVTWRWSDGDTTTAMGPQGRTAPGQDSL